MRDAYRALTAVDVLPCSMFAFGVSSRDAATRARGLSCECTRSSAIERSPSATARTTLLRAHARYARNTGWQPLLLAHPARRYEICGRRFGRAALPERSSRRSDRPIEKVSRSFSLMTFRSGKSARGLAPGGSFLATRGQCRPKHARALRVMMPLR